MPTRSKCLFACSGRLATCNSLASSCKPADRSDALLAAPTSHYFYFIRSDAQPKHLPPPTLLQCACAPQRRHCVQAAAASFPPLRPPPARVPILPPPAQHNTTTERLSPVQRASGAPNERSACISLRAAVTLGRPLRRSDDSSTKVHSNFEQTLSQSESRKDPLVSLREILQ